MNEGIEQGLHLGAQVYVSRCGEPAADFALGESEPGEPMRPDTLMIWLSAGKPITAVAIAQLFEAGSLNLDDPVAKHVPEFAAHGKDRITIRHVLTHTGGFRKVRFRFPEDGWDTIIAKICEAEPEWPPEGSPEGSPDEGPGKKAAYHPHTGWFMLGQIVQRLTGEALPGYLRRHIFEPLAMADSWLGMDAANYDRYVNAGRLGALMDTSRTPPRPHVFHQRPHLTLPNPGSNAVGPMRELGRFYEMVLNGGQLDGTRILEPETVELFAGPQRVNMFDHTFQHTIDWGLGLIRDSKHHGRGEDPNVPYGYGPHASPHTVGHSGWQSVAAFCDPDFDLAVAILCNGTPGEKPHYRRMHRVLGAVYEDLGLA